MEPGQTTHETKSRLKHTQERCLPPPDAKGLYPVWAVREGYCRRHPETRLGKSEVALGYRTDCWKCKEERKKRSREKRALLWESGVVFCKRHPERIANMSRYVANGRRQCSSCCGRRADGSYKPSYKKYKQKLIEFGFNAARVHRYKLRKRLAERAW